MRYNQSSVFLRNSLNKITIVLFFVQLYIDSSVLNIYSNILILFTCLLSNNILFNKRFKSTQEAFLSTIVFVTIASNSIVPLVATTLEQKPVIYNLAMPLEVLLLRLVYAIVLLVICFIISKSNSRIINFWHRIGNRFYIQKILSYKTIWFLGWLGLLLFILAISLNIPLFKRVFSAIKFIMLLPFVLLFEPYLSQLNKNGHKVRLIIFYVLNVVLSIISNSRMGMVQPILVLAFSTLFLTFNGRIDLKNKILLNKSQLIKGSISIILFFVLMIRISDAIVEVRKFRDDIGAIELFILSINTVISPSIKQPIKDLTTNNSKNIEFSNLYNWSEEYIDNPFLNRFVALKFDDNCLIRASILHEQDKTLIKKFNTDRILAILPSPILKLLNINIDKDYIISFSFGDFLDTLVNGTRLHGFKTGSLLVNLFILYGVWGFVPVVFILNYILLLIFSSLVSHPHKVIVAPVLFVMLPQLYLRINSENMSNLISIFLREVPQIIILYFIIITVVRSSFIKLFLNEKSCRF